MALRRATTHATRTLAWIGVAVLGLTVVRAEAAPVAAADTAARRGACTIVGTPGDDVLVGTPRRDVICGFGGDDRIDGRGGDDVLRGGDGDDVLIGGPGDDLIWGGAGDDVLRGGAGDDRLRGGAGADRLYGGRGDDGLRGGAGDDRLYGGPGTDRLWGKAGHDLLVGGPGRDGLSCGTGGDQVVGGKGDAVGKDCTPGKPGQPKPPGPDPETGGGAPTAVDDTFGTDEDTVLVLPLSGAGSPAANDTDPDDDVLTVTAVRDAVGGTVVIAGGTIRFTPTADLCGAGSFGYTVADGTGRSATGRVRIDIACVDDAPVARDDTATLTEDDPATPVDVLANDTDADGDPLVVDAVTQPARGAAVLDGTVVTYRPDADQCTAPGDAPDSFTYTLRGGGPQATATVTVTVACVDDPPVAEPDVFVVGEHDPVTALDVLANDTDVDGGPKHVVHVGAATHGEVLVAEDGAGLTYRPAPTAACVPPLVLFDTFAYRLNGGSVQTVTVMIGCQLDPAVANDDTATMDEDSPATAIPVLDNDQARDQSLSIASVRQPAHGAVVVTGGGSGLTYQPDPDYCNSQPGGAPDEFGYTLATGVSASVKVTVTCVPDALVLNDDTATMDEDSPATRIEVVANDIDPEGGALRVTALTPAAHGTVVITADERAVTYRPDADYCNSQLGGVPDEFTYTVNDGPSATVRVTVTCVYDPPVANDDTATTLEDSFVTIPVTANDIAGDDPAVVQDIAQAPANGTATIAPGGLAVEYLPHANFCTAPGGPTDDFVYRLVGGRTATVAVSVTCVNDAPVAQAQLFAGVDAAVGMTPLLVTPAGGTAPSLALAHKSVTGDLLAEAGDVDNPRSDLAVVAGSRPSTLGGTVVLRADGSFTYTPPADCSITIDTFSFTLTDGDEVSAPAWTTVGISGCVRYVDNTSIGGNGSAGSPYPTLAQAVTAGRANDTIYVYAGDGTTTGYDTAVALKAGQRLLGETRDLVVDGVRLASGVPGSRPRLTAPGEVISLASGNTVAGLRVDPGTGSAVLGGSGDASGTIADLRIVDTGTAAAAPAFDLDGTSGTFTVTDLEIDNSGASGTTSASVGMRLRGAGTVTIGGTSRIVAKGAPALVASSTNLTGSQLVDVTVTGSSAGGVDLSATTGAVGLGTVSLRTTAGTAPALRLVNTGAVSVGPASSLDATGGPALEVSNAPASSLVFASVASSGSATRGVTLTGLGTGTFRAPAGRIAGNATTAFVVDGGSGEITFGGAIDDGAGGSVEVRNRSAGTVTLSGTITDSADVGGGVLITANTGGSTVLTGAGSTLSTGAADAIAVSASVGHRLELSGGGLQLATTSGDGVDASNGGTFSISGTGNRVASTTGRALSVLNTTIGANDLVLERVSSNGAPSGIVLQATGDTGALRVTGAGGTCTGAVRTGCTGGEIAASVGTGVVLDDTLLPSLTRMWIHDAGDFAIRGDRTRGLNLLDSVVSGVNGDGGDDAAVALTELGGPSLIARTHLSGGYADTLRVANTTGDLARLTVDTVTFARSGNRPLNDAVQLDAGSEAGSFPVTVRDSTVDGATGDLLQYDYAGKKTGDLVLTGNAFANTHPATAPGGGGVVIHQSGSSANTLTATITGNQFSGAIGAGVLITKAVGTSSQQGTFSGNGIGIAGTADSGSRTASGLKVQSLGGGTVRWGIADNRIRGYNAYGIEVVAGGSGTAQSGVLQTTVTGNLVAEPGTDSANAGLPKQGLHYNIGTTVGDTFAACADIHDNDLASSSFAAAGIDADIRLRQRQTTTLRLPGYGGAADATAGVQSFVAGRNVGLSGTPDVRAEYSAAAGSGGFAGGGAPCS